MHKIAAELVLIAKDLMAESVKTVKLRGTNVEVLAKPLAKGDDRYVPMTYANLAQANKMVEKLKGQGVDAGVKSGHPFLILVTKGGDLQENKTASDRTASKIKFVVRDNNVLGYVDSRRPDTLNVLAASVIKGASHIHPGDSLHMMPDTGNYKYRPATRKDFKDFRISTEGYEEDEHYDFPKASIQAEETYQIFNSKGEHAAYTAWTGNKLESWEFTKEGNPAKLDAAHTRYFLEKMKKEGIKVTSKPHFNL